MKTSEAKSDKYYRILITYEFNDKRSDSRFVIRFLQSK